MGITKARTLLSGALVVGLVAACSHGANHSTTVDVLWYGKQADGNYSHGITPVTISSARTESPDVILNIDENENELGNSSWNAATWTAATVGLLASTTDPRNLELNYQTQEDIDGPSGGALIALGTLADLSKFQIPSDIGMTGTINPDGGIGPVGGIPEKVRAAHDAGFTKLFIPEGQAREKDPTTNLPVDVIQLGESLGIEVVEAPSIQSVYRDIGGSFPDQDQADPGPIDRDVEEFLLTRAKQLQPKVRNQQLDPATTSTRRSDRKKLQSALKLAQADLANELRSRNGIDAYTLATLSIRAAEKWNADSAVQLLLRQEGRAHARQALIARAGRLQATLHEQTAKVAATSVENLEQLVGLPSVVDWGTSSQGLTAVAIQELGESPEPDNTTLSRIARSLAEAEFNGQYYLKDTAQAIALTGKYPIQDKDNTLSLMASYAGLLTNATHANINYYNVQLEQAGIRKATQQSLDLESALASLITTYEGDTQEAIVQRLAAATSGFVGSLVVANTTTNALTSGGNQTSLSSILISDPEGFARQVDLARDTTATLSSVLAARNIDTTMPRWRETWGYHVTKAPPELVVSDQLRHEGLIYMWFSNISSTLLTTASSPSE